MRQHYRPVLDEHLVRLSRDPVLLHAYVITAPVTEAVLGPMRQAGLPETFLAQLVAAAEVAAILPRPAEIELWDAVARMLGALGAAVRGVERLGDPELGEDAPRIVRPADVKRVARALPEAPVRFDRDVLRGTWPDVADEPDAPERLRRDFHRLVGIYARAARRNRALLCWLA